MPNEPRNPNEGKRATPNAATLATVRARLHVVEHCIVRSAADAADQVRELARLLDATAEHVQQVNARLDALERSQPDDGSGWRGPVKVVSAADAVARGAAMYDTCGGLTNAAGGCGHNRARHELGGEPCECRADGCACAGFVESAK